MERTIKKIGFICLGLASLALAGCFHIPDEDWLPSRNKVGTGNIEKDKDMEDAINSIMDGFNMISSDWNDLKSNDSDEISTDEGSENIIEVEEAVSNEETVGNKETTNNEVENEEVEENITPEK